jgi:glycosyltransferase involved in cell wall biosynthesis
MADDVPWRNDWVVGVVLHDFQLGGAERVAIRLANAWAAMGCKVILFCGAGAGPQRQLLGAAVEVIIADPPVIKRLPGSAAKLGSWVASHPAAAGVGAFHLPGNSYFKAAGPLAAADGCVFAVISNSLWRVDRSLIRNLVFAALTRWRLRNVAGAISMSPALLRQARRLLGKRLADVALPNALFDGLPELPASSCRRWHICAVGRLVPQKNFALLLRSFALLDDLPVTLSVAGDGPQMAELQQLAAALGVAERVTFLGAVANAVACMAEAEVMVSTSDYEGYPAVVVEALAAGAYVISSNCSVGIADILATPELGEIVDGHRPEDFEGALRRFFAGTARQETSKRLALARRLVQSHVAQQAAQRHLEYMGPKVGAAQRKSQRRTSRV